MAIHVAPFVQLAVGTSIYAANDALGAKFSFPSVPKNGTIMSATVINNADTPGSDNLDIVLFTEDIAGTAANAAFDPTDAELRTAIGSILINTWSVFANNEIGYQDNIGLPYYARNSVIYGQCVLRAGTIPAGPPRIDTARGEAVA